VGFGEEDAAVFADDIGGGDGQAPAWFAVDEGDVDEDGAVVVLVVLGDGVDEAEFFSEGAGGVMQHGKGRPCWPAMKSLCRSICGPIATMSASRSRRCRRGRARLRAR